MANIPVEKKSGFPWWLLLLGLLLLALLAFFLWPDDEIEEVYDDEIVAVDPVEPIETTGVITSWAELQNVAERRNLVGRRVNIDDLTVTRVSGDSTFFVGDRTTPESERLFVVLRNLGESETGAMGRDGRYNVDRMEEVRLVGTVEALQPSDPDVWALDDTDADMVRSGNVFVAAERLGFEDDMDVFGDMDDMDMDNDMDM